MTLDATDLIVAVRPDSVRGVPSGAELADKLPDIVKLTGSITRHPQLSGKKYHSAGATKKRLEQDDKLINLIARAHLWSKNLRSGQFKTIMELAAYHGVDKADCGKQVRLVYLAPDIVTAIVQGRSPASLTANILRRLSDLPADWGEQRKLLDFC